MSASLPCESGGVQASLASSSPGSGDTDGGESKPKQDSQGCGTLIGILSLFMGFKPFFLSLAFSRQSKICEAQYQQKGAEIYNIEILYLYIFHLIAALL